MWTNYFPGVSDVFIVTSKSFPSGTEAVNDIFAPHPERKEITIIKANPLANFSSIKC